MKIVLTGSLGNIGKPLASGLVSKGHNVTVISSNADKQTEIEKIGVEAAIGSIDNVDFLKTTFTGADAVYLMIPPNLQELNSLAFWKRIAENYRLAIEQSQVNRIVVLSSWGAHLDKGTGTIVGAHHLEKILNQLENVHKTYIRACCFYYNLLNYVGMIKNEGIIGTNFRNDDKIVWVHPTDIADVVAEELEKTNAEKLSIRYVASDEITASETARILGEAIGKPDLEWYAFTDDQVKNSLLENGIPESLAADLVDINAAISSGKMGEDYEMNKPTLGNIKMKDYAIEFAAIYNKS